MCMSEQLMVMINSLFNFQYHGLAWRQCDRGGNVNLVSCGDIGCRGAVADDFGIACHVEERLRAFAVEDGEHGVAVEGSCDDVNALVGYELRLRSLGDGLVALPPV